DALGARVRLPVQERRTGFTQRQKHQALVAALAAGCRRARDSDFVLKPDAAARAALGLARWPDASQLTRHLRAFRPQHVAALRAAVEAVTAEHAMARRRLRRGGRVVVDLDQSPISAHGRSHQGAQLGRRVRFVGRAFSDATAANWARDLGPDARWVELSPVKWVCELGEGPAAATRPDVVCRRVLVRSTGARHRAGYTALVTNIPAD